VDDRDGCFNVGMDMGYTKKRGDLATEDMGERRRMDVAVVIIGHSGGGQRESRGGGVRGLRGIHGSLRWRGLIWMPAGCEEAKDGRNVDRRLKVAGGPAIGKRGIGRAERTRASRESKRPDSRPAHGTRNLNDFDFEVTDTRSEHGSRSHGTHPVETRLTEPWHTSGRNTAHRAVAHAG
jgi:hypothetical protein